MLNWFRILALPEVFLVVVVIGWICNRIPMKNTKRPAPSSRNFLAQHVLMRQMAEAKKRLPDPHTHVVDFTRSEIRVLVDGSVVAGCTIAGCKESVQIGRDVHSLVTPIGEVGLRA